MKIYLASPFFNSEEINHVDNVVSLLRLEGHTVFNPKENQLEQHESGSRAWRTDVFRNDLRHIDWCDAVVSIVKDNYDDTGTSFELGYAYKSGKLVYVYNPSGNTINLMLTDSLHGYFESLGEIAEYDFETAPIKPYEGNVI